MNIAKDDLTKALAWGRVALGASLLLAPSLVAGWVGRGGTTPVGRSLTRSLAARDVALGALTLDAVNRGGDSLRHALWAGVMSDAVDAFATLRGYRHFTGKGRALALASAAAATAVGIGLATSE